MRTAVVIYLFIFSIIHYPGIAQDAGSRYQSYLAHIAAANASLRLHETAEAKRWLNQCPRFLRGWEWNYLRNRCDASERQLHPDQGAPTGLDFNDDGSLLAVPSDGGRLYVYDVESWKEKTVFAPAATSLTAARFQPGSNAIAFATSDGRIGMWQMGEKDPLWIINTGGEGPIQIDFNHNGRLLAFSDWVQNDGNIEGVVHLLDAQTGKEQWQETFGDRPVNRVRFSTDGTLLAAAGQNGRVTVWNLPGMQRVYTLAMDAGARLPETMDIAFSPAGNFLAAAGSDGRIKWWHLGTGELQNTVTPFRDPVAAIAFSQIGDQLIIGSEKGVVKAYDIKSNRHLGTFFGHESSIHEIAFHPSRAFYVSAAADGAVRVWPWALHPPFSDENGLPTQNYAFDLSAGGRWIATAGPQLSISLWRTSQGTLEHSIAGPPGPLVNTVAFGPDSSRLAVANWGETVYLYAPFQEKLIRKFEGLEDRCIDLAYSSDGRFLAAASRDSTVVVWRVADGQLVQRLKHRTGVTQVAFSNDSGLLASGTDAGSLSIYEVSSWQRQHRIKAHDGPVLHLSFDPGGEKLLTTGADETARIWMVADGARRTELEGHAQKIWSGAWSPDGERVVTGSADETVRFWDPITGKTILILSEGFTDRINDLSFSPEGDKLYINASGAQIRVADGSSP